MSTHAHEEVEVGIYGLMVEFLTPEALLAYDDLRQRLRAELAIAPGPQLRAYHQTLLSASAADDLPTAPEYAPIVADSQRCAPVEPLTAMSDTRSPSWT